jgi:hypothetical protein
MLTAAPNLPHPADQRKPKPEPYQLLPELPPEQFEALKADIGKRGVIVPVLLDEYRDHHRWPQPRQSLPRVPRQRIQWRHADLRPIQSQLGGIPRQEP